MMPIIKLTFYFKPASHDNYIERGLIYRFTLVYYSMTKKMFNDMCTNILVDSYMLDNRTIIAYDKYINK